MEKIYRIASVLIMAAAMFLLSFLLLPLYVAAARLGISPWFVQLSIFGGLLLYAWWFMIWNDAQSEPQKDSRLQSVLVWFGTIAIVYAVFRFFARSSGFFLYFCGVNTDYLIVPLLLVLAAECIIFRPFKRHKQGLLFGIIGTICGLLLWEAGKQLGDVSYNVWYFLHNSWLVIVVMPGNHAGQTEQQDQRKNRRSRAEQENRLEMRYTDLPALPECG